MFPDALQTKRLFLRPIAPGDAPAVFSLYAQDPQVSQFLTWRPHTRLEETRAYIGHCLAATSSRTYAITLRDNGQVIGAFDIRRPASWRVGFGYVLARAFWGYGFMTEALAAVVDWALSQPDIWRVGDVCDVENRASVRVMENAGLALEGILRCWAVHPSLGAAPRDCFSYARVRAATMAGCGDPAGVRAG